MPGSPPPTPREVAVIDQMLAESRAALDQITAGMRTTIETQGRTPAVAEYAPWLASCDPEYLAALLTAALIERAEEAPGDR